MVLALHDCIIRLWCRLREYYVYWNVVSICLVAGQVDFYYVQEWPFQFSHGRVHMYMYVCLDLCRFHFQWRKRGMEWDSAESQHSLSSLRPLLPMPRYWVSEWAHMFWCSVQIQLEEESIVSTHRTTILSDFTLTFCIYMCPEDLVTCTIVLLVSVYVRMYVECTKIA